VNGESSTWTVILMAVLIGPPLFYHLSRPLPFENAQAFLAAHLIPA
jgi:hypothetical protein